MRSSLDKLGRTPLLVGLMSGAGREAVEVLVTEGEQVMVLITVMIMITMTQVEITDDVGRSCVEAAVLYCDHQVVQIIFSEASDKCQSHFNKVSFIYKKSSRGYLTFCRFGKRLTIEM